MILVVAKEYGQSPQDVEDWEEYWFERAVLKLQGENLQQKRELDRMKKNSRR